MGSKLKMVLDRYSLQTKLVLMFVGGFTAFLLYFLVTMVLASSNQQKMTKLVESQLPIIELSERLARNLNSIRDQIVQSAFSQSMDGVTGVNGLDSTIQQDFKRLMEVDSKDAAMLAQLSQEYAATFKESTALLQEVVAGIESLAKSQAKFQSFSASFQRIEQQIVSIKAQQEAGLRDSVESTKSASQRAIMLGVSLLLCAIPFSYVFFLVLRDINAQLTGASERLRDASEKILAIADKAQVSSHQLAASSSEQAASVLESVASMDEMKQMLSQTVMHSDKAQSASEASYVEAQDGKTVIDSMRGSMLEIERSYDELEDVNALMREIRSKTNVINDIVFKTQLLSFNASIEAARAGRHGLGFAVVAAEVGKLAEMSGQAAEVIERMLEDSAQRVADTIQRTKQKVDVANTLSHQCSEVFDRIIERNGQTKKVVSFITQAATEQSAGIANVGQAMQEINRGAGDTDQLAQSIARLSSQLKDETSVLASTVGGLNRLVQGDSDDDSDESGAAGGLFTDGQEPQAA